LNQSDPSGFAAGIPRPAVRAFVSAGYPDLLAISRASLEDLLSLDGVGPKAIRLLQEALVAAGLPWLKL
jgi:DNA uptake protein ComE-like DNA-binding protein